MYLNRRNIAELATWRPFGTSVRFSEHFWISCWTVLLGLSWVVPNRFHPLTEFYADFWMASCLLLGYSALFWYQRDTHQKWPAPAIALLALSIVPWLQLWAGLIVSRGQASLSFAYLLGAAAVCAGGFIAHRLRGWDALHLLFAAMLLGALLNAGILFTQYADLYPYDDISFPGSLILRIAENQRPTGNIAQANIAGTLCVWGAIAGWWFMAHRKIRWSMMTAISAYLMLAMVLTQSRVALVNVLLIATVASILSLWAWWTRWFHNRSLNWVSQPLTWYLQPLIWLVWVIASLVILAWINAEFGWGQGLRERVFTEPLRPLIYLYFSKAALAQPFFGYGMTHLMSVQAVAVPDGVALGSYFLHSHNLLLDTLLWFGLPLGGLIIAGLIALAWMFVGSIRNQASLACVAILVVFGFHSMVELPHMWGIMLLPCCWLTGALFAHSLQSKEPSPLIDKFLIVSVSRKIAITIACVAATLLTVLWIDYVMLQREFWALRMDNARIGPRGLDQVENAILLNHIEDRIRLGRLKNEALHDPQKLAWIGRASRGFPSPSTHFLYVKALALHSTEQETTKEMERLNRLTTKLVLQKFTADWEKFRAENPAVNMPAWVQSGALLSPDVKLPLGVTSGAATTILDE